MQTSAGETSADAQRDAAAPLFVINLCASTTPVALAHPDSAELKKYTFFVTRRREEGRERFRLHMGYFDTLADAESLLALVRDVYPAAWCGPAPDGRATPKRSLRVPAITGTAVRTSNAAMQTAQQLAAETPIAEKAAAAKQAVAKPPVAIRSPAPQVAAPLSAVTATPVPEQSAEAAHEPELTLEAPPPPIAVAVPVALAVAAEPGPVRIAAPAEELSFELETMSNVREVIAQLTDAPAKPIATQAPARPVEAPRAAEPAKPVATKAIATKAVAAKPEAPKPASKKTIVLSATQALSLLETPPRDGTPAKPLKTKATTEPADIALLMPEDTQTLRDIKLDEQANAPACFAVQLVWAVQPISTEKLPHLAIFDAYKLYHVEGNRNGRRWYGLRLGFFTDPVAAKHVASYLRSEYASVAVVPVAAKEKASAIRPLAAVPAPQKTPLPRPDPASIPTVKPVQNPSPRTNDVAGFELLAEDPPAPTREVFDEGSGPRIKLGTPVTPVAKSPPKASGKAPGKRVVVRQRPAPPGAPNPLEETLEMLGASTLTLDESREIINDVGSRKPVDARKAKPGRFAKLLNRLSDRKDG